MAVRGLYKVLFWPKFASIIFYYHLEQIDKASILIQIVHMQLQDSSIFLQFLLIIFCFSSLKGFSSIDMQATLEK